MSEKNIKKTAAKKVTSIKKSTAKKTVAKKSTTAVKKTATKKATAKKATTTAKKTVAKKSAVKKATAKKATTTKKKVVKKTVSYDTINKINNQAIQYVPKDVDIVRELPERYNETKLAFMVRDPEWAYLYWDVSDNDHSKNNLSKHSLHIKIFRLSGVDISKHDEYIDIEVSSSYGSWYIMLGIPHCYFIAELGYYDDKGRFIVLAKSNIVYAPRNTVSNLYDDQWMSSDELTKILFKSYDVSNTLSSASLFNMINLYTLSGLPTNVLQNNDKK